MSNKFIRVKKTVVLIVSLGIMMGSMVGCSTIKSDELLELINSGSSVAIELAQPSYSVNVQGEKAKFEWVQLDQMKTNDFRKEFDEIFNINTIAFQGQDRKTGVLFVDEAGNRKGNAVLVDALKNKAFVEKYWEDSKVKKAIGELASEVYTDAGDSEEQNIAASINAYYNLFTDRINPDTFNSNESLSREEFYSAVYRSENGVDEELKSSPEFESAVGGGTEHTKYAEKIANYGFLQVENKGLDENSYKGAISRAEAVYMLVNMNFNEELKNADAKGSAFSDIKNGGDLALKLKFKEENKESKEIVGKDRWQAFTLVYMMQNPNKGLQDELYKAMVVAKNLDLITSSESRWDEPLSKGEAIQMIINTHLAKNKISGYASTAEYGQMIIEKLPEKQVVVIPNQKPSESEKLPIDPDTIPKDGFITYREIRECIDNGYAYSIKSGYSKEEALKYEAEFVKNFGTTLEELNRMIGYGPVGEAKQVASNPTIPTDKTTTPKTSTTKTPTNTTTKPEPDGPPTEVYIEPDDNYSKYGYKFTEIDKNGNGFDDATEYQYLGGAEFKISEFGYLIRPSDLNGDGVNDHSLPPGTPNPFSMP